MNPLLPAARGWNAAQIQNRRANRGRQRDKLRFSHTARTQIKQAAHLPAVRAHGLEQKQRAAPVHARQTGFLQHAGQLVLLQRPVSSCASTSR